MRKVHAYGQRVNRKELVTLAYDPSDGPAVRIILGFGELRDGMNLRWLLRVIAQHTVYNAPLLMDQRLAQISPLARFQWLCFKAK